MPMGTVSRPAADSQTAHLAQRRLKRRLSPLALRPVVVSGGSASGADSWAMLEVLIREPGNEPPSAAQVQPLEKQWPSLSHRLWLISQTLRMGSLISETPTGLSFLQFCLLSVLLWPQGHLSLLLLQKPCYLSRCHWPEPTPMASLGPNNRVSNNMDFLRGRGAKALEQAAKKLGNASQSSASSNKWQLTNPPLSLSSCFP